MNTISKHMMALILDYIEGGLTETRNVDAVQGYKSNGTFRLECAKKWLLEAALADVTVEALAESAP